MHRNSPFKKLKKTNENWKLNDSAVSRLIIFSLTIMVIVFSNPKIIFFDLASRIEITREVCDLTIAFMQAFEDEIYLEGGIASMFMLTWSSNHAARVPYLFPLLVGSELEAESGRACPGDTADL